MACPRRSRDAGRLLQTAPQMGSHQSGSEGRASLEAHLHRMPGAIADPSGRVRSASKWERRGSRLQLSSVANPGMPSSGFTNDREERAGTRGGGDCESTTRGHEEMCVSGCIPTNSHLFVIIACCSMQKVSRQTSLAGRKRVSRTDEMTRPKPTIGSRGPELGRAGGDAGSSWVELWSLDGVNGAFAVSASHRIASLTLRDQTEAEH